MIVLGSWTTTPWPIQIITSVVLVKGKERRRKVRRKKKGEGGSPRKHQDTGGRKK
jgi:hypothetical protein